MNIKIYQAYYKKDQIDSLDPAFIPLDNTKNRNPLWMEYWLFLNHYKNEDYKLSNHSGILSWKFNDKTYLTGKEFINFIENNPGYDVYFINPYPYQCYMYKNVWIQGERWHPGLLEVTQNTLDKKGYGIDLMSLINDETNTLYCNYWVGNNAFWERYMEFTLPLFKFINESLSDEEKRRIYTHADEGRAETATYFSFIFERLFSTLLLLDNNIKYLHYEYNYNELLKIKHLPIQMNHTPTAHFIMNKRLNMKLKRLDKNGVLDKVIKDSEVDILSESSILINESVSLGNMKFRYERVISDKNSKLERIVNHPILSPIIRLLRLLKRDSTFGDI